MIPGSSPQNILSFRFLSLSFIFSVWLPYCCLFYSFLILCLFLWMIYYISTYRVVLQMQLNCTGDFGVSPSTYSLSAFIVLYHSKELITNAKASDIIGRGLPTLQWKKNKFHSLVIAQRANFVVILWWLCSSAMIGGEALPPPALVGRHAPGEGGTRGWPSSWMLATLHAAQPLSAD